jgi:hypothetical protein
MMIEDPREYVREFCVEELEMGEATSGELGFLVKKT